MKYFSLLALGCEHAETTTEGRRTLSAILSRSGNEIIEAIQICLVLLQESRNRLERTRRLSSFGWSITNNLLKNAVLTLSRFFIFKLTSDANKKPTIAQQFTAAHIATLTRQRNPLNFKIVCPPPKQRKLM